jgi:hypothetical protein
MTAVANLVGLLPVSVANLGTREACLAAFFTGVLQPPRPEALAVSWGLSQGLVLSGGSAIIGFACWQLAPMGLRTSLRSHDRPPHEPPPPPLPG